MKIGYLKLKGKDEVLRVFFEEEINISPQTKFLTFYTNIEEEKILVVNIDYLISLEYRDKEIKQ